MLFIADKDIKYVFWMIHALKPDTNIKNEMGNTPLHNTALQGNLRKSIFEAQLVKPSFLIRPV